MKRFAHLLLPLLAHAIQKELIQMVEYVKIENRMLRSRLPAHIETTPAERTRLLKLGVRLEVPGGHQHRPSANLYPLAERE
jgi:hypothetical protein